MSGPMMMSGRESGACCPDVPLPLLLPVELGAAAAVDTTLVRGIGRWQWGTAVLVHHQRRTVGLEPVQALLLKVVEGDGDLLTIGQAIGNRSHAAWDVIGVARDGLLQGGVGFVIGEDATSDITTEQPRRLQPGLVPRARTSRGGRYAGINHLCSSLDRLLCIRCWRSAGSGVLGSCRVDLGFGAGG